MPTAKNKMSDAKENLQIYIQGANMQNKAKS